MSGDFVAQILVRQKSWLKVGPVLFGAVLIHLSLGTYHTFGNMLPYMASYMKNHTDVTIKHEQLIWIPTLQGCFPFAMVIGGIFSEKFGPRLTTAFGCYLMSLGVLLSAYTIKIGYYSFLITYGIMFGFGQGIAYVVAVSCVINWAPEKVGLVSGIVAGGFGISSSIFAPIQTELINPENKPASSDGYFNDTALIERVPSVFTKLSLVYFIMQTIGLIFICDPPAEYVRKYLSTTALIDMAWLSKRRTKLLSRTTSVSFSRYNYSRLSTNDDNDDINDSPKRREDKDKTRLRRSNSCDPDDTNVIVIDDNDSDQEFDAPKPVSLHPREVLKSSTFYCLFIALFCCSFYGNLWYNLYKTFGETFIDDDMFFAIAFSIGTVANALARIGWGQLTDKTSFQISLSIATCIATVLLLTMPMTVLFGKLMYIIWLTLMFICLAATHALFITAIVRCFGSEHKAVNYGFLILATTLSGTVLAVGTETLLSKIGYNWLFIFSSMFPFIAFLITTSIKVTPQGHLII